MVDIGFGIQLILICDFEHTSMYEWRDDTVNIS
jgi:hypothetical protein